MISNRSKLLGSQRGLASVELAIVTPFLLIIMLLAAEFTRVFWEYNTLTKAVRDGARYASMNVLDGTKQFQLDANTMNEIKNQVVFSNVAGAGTSILSTLSVTDVTVAERTTGTGPLARDHVEVTATYDFQPLGPVLSAMGFLSQDVNMNFQLVASSTMRAID